MILGLLSLGAFFGSCGVNEHGITEPDLLALTLSTVTLPGLLFLFAGYSALLKERWWLALVCAVILCLGAIWVGFIGSTWHITAPVAALSLAAGMLLIFSKDNFY